MMKVKVECNGVETTYPIKDKHEKYIYKILEVFSEYE